MLFFRPKRSAVAALNRLPSQFYLFAPRIFRTIWPTDEPLSASIPSRHHSAPPFQRW